MTQRKPAKATETILVVPDIHAPYHNEASLRVVIAAAKRLRPTRLVIIGDAVDCYPISFYPRDPTRRANLKDEIEAANAVTKRLGGLSDEVIYVEGNHEDRLRRYLQSKAPELYGLVTMRDLLQVTQRQWQWVDYGDFVKIGKVAFTHDVGQAGKHAAANSLAAFGGNLVFGHSHRGGIVYDGTIDGEHRVAMNVGWIGDAKAIDYSHKAIMRSWQQGFGVVEQDTAGNSWMQFVPIIGRKALVRGEQVTA